LSGGARLFHSNQEARGTIEASVTIRAVEADPGDRKVSDTSYSVPGKFVRP